LRSGGNRNHFHRIGFLLPLFVEQRVHCLPDVRKSVLQFGKGGSIVLKTFVTVLLQALERLEAGIQILLRREIKRLRRLSEGFIEDFRRKLAGFDQFGSSLTFLVALDLVFIANDARVLIHEPGISGIGDRR